MSDSEITGETQERELTEADHDDRMHRPDCHSSDGDRFLGLLNRQYPANLAAHTSISLGVQVGL